MRTIKWVLETGVAGCNIEDEFEVDDNTTDEEIDELAKDAVFSNIGWSWYEAKDDLLRQCGYY